MRTRNPQPKELRTVEIPDELRHSLLEAVEYLEEASVDPDLPIDFGDAIQVGAICGGRIGPDHRPFAFTYYPTGDGKYGRWSLELHETEMQDIADGAKVQLSLYCCTSESCRMKFTSETQLCFYCDYVDDADTVAFQQKLRDLADSVSSKEEFVAGYVRLKSNAFGMGLIGDYNSIDGLGQRLGWFSALEADELIKKARMDQE